MATETSSQMVSRCFIFMYFLLPHWVPAPWCRRAQISMRAELPSGKVPTTRVRRRISRLSRSMTLLVRMPVQCSNGNSQWVSVSSTPSSAFLAASFRFIACSSSTTAPAFSRAAFLLSWAWMALSIFATSFTLEGGVTENTLR